MSFSGGVYTLPGPALVTGEVVSATENNQFRNDVAGAFNVTMLRNGTSTATANLPMGGYKLTGLGAPSTNGDALSYGAAAVVTTLTSTSLTATRVPYAGTGGLLQDASTFTFDGTTLTAGGFSGPHNGTVGATTPNTGAFTTLSASSTVSGTGFSNYLASPPAIGGTAAAAGSFTTLTTSSTVTVNGGTANGVAYLNGSKVLTTGSGLVFDGSNLGLGVTPSAWSAYKVLQISGNNAVYANGNDELGFVQNAYYNGGWKYGTTGVAATWNYQYQGKTVWNTAPSGTAGNAITFTQAMTLDASGNLGIGTSSPSSGARLTVTGASSSIVRLFNNNQTTGSFELGQGFSTGSDNIGYVWNNSNAAMVFGTNATERMRIDSSGNLLVRGTSAINGYTALQVFGTGNSNDCIGIKNSNTATLPAIVFWNSSGNVVGNVLMSNTATSFNTSSDYRLKENVQPIQNALATVAQLNPVTYNWKADGSDGQGFIAHELQEHAPYAVTGEKDGEQMQAVDYGKITPLLTAALQEAMKKIEQLEARIATLEAK